MRLKQAHRSQCERSLRRRLVYVTIDRRRFTPTFLVLLEALPLGSDETFRVNSLVDRCSASLKSHKIQVAHVDAAPSLFLAQPLQGEEGHELLCDTNTSRSSSKEQDTMVGERFSRCSRCQFGGIEETREDNGT